MDAERYNILADAHHLIYEFQSVGPQGSIRKIVRFTKLTKEVFNLELSDWDEIDQRADNTVRSNNRDTEKILFTVAHIVLDFSQSRRGVVIFAQGSTPSRTRMYQMAVKRHLKNIRNLFDIGGFWNGQWIAFEPHLNYEAFAVRLKRKL